MKPLIDLPLSMKNLKGNIKAKSEKAYSAIRDHVFKLRTPLDEPLSEVRLASLLGMSRTPVREALRRLKSEGVLISYGKRGTFVNVPTPREVREVLEVRIFLESAAARLAAKKIDLERLREYEKLFEEYRMGKREGDFVKLGRAFHFFIIESSGNTVLKDILSNLYTKLEMIRLFSYGFRRKEAAEEHLDIVRALLKRDEALSYKCMETHLTNAFETLKQIL